MILVTNCGSPIPGHRSHVGVGLAVLVGLAVALVSALLVGGARSANRASGLIAFTREDGVYAMGTDGTGVRLLRRTGGWAFRSGLAWSPNGRRLAFIGAGSAAEPAIWVMDADGKHAVRLDLAAGSKAAMSPTWSADGHKIAFTAYRDEDRDIWVMNADGSNQRRLARTPRRFETEVDWSPIGGRVVFTNDGYIPDVHVMDTDGSNLRNLTPGRFEGVEPNWSPDGHRIAFTRWQGANFSTEIYVTDPSGRSRIRLTDNAFPDRDPAWSSDGNQIAFVREDLSLRFAEIYLMNADGTGVRRLTHNHVGEANPAWQPTPPRHR